jgi:hypothetical protein
MLVRGGERKRCRVGAEGGERSVGRYEVIEGGDVRAEMWNEERDLLKRENSKEKRKTAEWGRKSRRVRPLRLPERRSSFAAVPTSPLSSTLSSLTRKSGRNWRQGCDGGGDGCDGGMWRVEGGFRGRNGGP